MVCPEYLGRQAGMQVTIQYIDECRKQAPCEYVTYEVMSDYAVA